MIKMFTFKVRWRKVDIRVVAQPWGYVVSWDKWVFNGGQFIRI